jgi:sodium/bile acid cotransporter 7
VQPSCFSVSFAKSQSILGIKLYEAGMIFLKILKSLEPFVVVLFCTLLFAALLPPRGAAVALFDGMADAGIVLLFFLQGAKLSRQAIIGGMRSWKVHGAALLATYALFPILGLGIYLLAPIGKPIAVGLLFLTLLPSTVQSSVAFTGIAGGNVATAVCSASFSNLLGIVITPALVALLIHSGHAAASLAPVKSILFQLLIPFIVGHACQPLIGSFVSRHKWMVNMVDRGAILLVVYTAFGAATTHGLWHLVSAETLLIIIVLCCAMLAVALAVTWWTSNLLHFNHGDAIVMLFCGSKKSLATGVPMAGILFAPADIGMVLLPLMVFHQIQLIACAIIARRLAGKRSQAQVRAELA